MTEIQNQSDDWKNQALEAEVIKLQQEILRLKAENEELRSLQEIFSKAFYDNQTCMAITQIRRWYLCGC